jgi:probable rRNA maturation factor
MARSPRRSRAPVEIAWQANDPLPRGWRPWLLRLLAGYLAALGYPRHGVVLAVGSDALLKRLNTRYRRRARPTDILSFSYLDGGPEHRSGTSPALIGELAVSWPRTRAQARAHGWPPRTELARLLAHGCAHLAGYDHRTAAEDRAMCRVEERLLEGAGFAGLYPAAAPSRSSRAKPRRR